MVGGDDEDGSFGGLTKLDDVIGVAIENRPADSRRRRRTGNLGQGGAADGFKDNGARAMLFFSLDSLQELRALSNGIVVGVNDLEFDAKLAGSSLGRLRLLDLVIVVVGRERNEKTQFLHFETRPAG